MSFVPIRVKIEIEPTETEVVSIDTPSYSSEGCFQLVASVQSSMDIDILEEGLLRTSYPALRDALAESLSLQSEK